MLSKKHREPSPVAATIARHDLLNSTGLAKLEQQQLSVSEVCEPIDRDVGRTEGSGAPEAAQDFVCAARHRITGVIALASLQRLAGNAVVRQRPLQHARRGPATCEP